MGSVTFKVALEQQCDQIIQLLFIREGNAVAQLVEALRYKSEGRGFDSQWCHWNFSLT